MKLKYDLKSAIYSNSNKNETTEILKLIRSENVGIKTFYSLISLFGSAGTALKNIESMSIKGGRNKPIKIYSDEEVENEINEIKKIGGQLISYKDKKYSRLLSHISDPPPILSCIGNLELLNEEKIISVVGTRNASLMGKTLASKITKDLYDNDFTIVSGLARGIDTAAHEVSVDKTIAVIAGGLGHIYPSENKDLYYKIAKNGLIVSELKISSAPMAQNFPQRNRIVSGLSLGVLVVEATTKSGSLITARFALEQNREVFAIPGFPMDPRSNGTNKLIKQGAHIVECFSDIVENLPEYVNFIKRFSEKQINYDSVNERQHKFADIDQEITLEMRKKVFNSLSSIPVSLDLLYKELDIPIQILHTIILELELAGKISRNQVNKICLIY